MIMVAFLVVAAAATLMRVLATAPPDAPVGRFPWPTLAVNVAGAVVLGAIVGAQLWTNPVVATTAGLGSLTTFSTVAGEVEVLIRGHHRGRALAYLGLTLALGVAGAWIGLRLA